MSKAAMAAATLALAVSGCVDARPEPGAVYSTAASAVFYPPLPPAPVQPVAGSRWGGKIGGRWWAGVDAPGGWRAYRPPRRGRRLPAYWAAPRFHVADWSAYGLATPPLGYAWSRYYDDAVLIDARAEVRDAVSGVDWDRLDRARTAGLAATAGAL